MLSKVPPPNFEKKFDVVGCFVFLNDKFILLHRQLHKPNGDYWGLPAGKVDSGEDLKTAVIRETREETGIVLTPGTVEQSGTYYVVHNGRHFEWHVFSTKLKNLVSITINPEEHSEYRWVTKNEALGLNLVEDQDTSIELFFSNQK